MYVTIGTLTAFIHPDITLAELTEVCVYLSALAAAEVSYDTYPRRHLAHQEVPNGR